MSRWIDLSPVKAGECPKLREYETIVTLNKKNYKVAFYDKGNRKSFFSHPFNQAALKLTLKLHEKELDGIFEKNKSCRIVIGKKITIRKGRKIITVNDHRIHRLLKKTEEIINDTKDLPLSIDINTINSTLKLLLLLKNNKFKPLTGDLERLLNEQIRRIADQKLLMVTRERFVNRVDVNGDAKRLAKG